MYTHQPYCYCFIAMFTLGLLLQHCKQASRDALNMDSQGEEAPANSIERPPLKSYGPFPSRSASCVTFQQGEGNRWHAIRVQAQGLSTHVQQLDVGCSEDIDATLKHLQNQPPDYVKSRIHVLSPSQSPTGTGTIYLGRLGLRGGMEAEGDTVGPHSLHDAARRGQVAMLKYLIEEQGVDPHAKDDYGRTALHLAAEDGNIEVVGRSSFLIIRSTEWYLPKNHSRGRGTTTENIIIDF